MSHKKDNKTASTTSTIHADITVKNDDETMVNDECIETNALNQGERSMLHQFGYYFSISFFKNIGDIVYYKVSYGKASQTYPKAMEYQDTVIARYSELRNFNICLEKFPPKTLFKDISSKFIRNRLESLKNWFKYVLEKNEAEKLYKKLIELSKKINTSDQ